MAKVKSTGYTDTPIEGVTSLNFTRGLLNFEKDFRVKSDTAGQEVIITNLTCPIDRPEKIRLSYSDVANIYNGTGVEASVCSPTKRGVSILAQLTEVISITDSADPDYRIDLPVSYHLVIKVPTSDQLSAVDIQTGLGRLLSGLYNTGSLDTTRLEAILRGSLRPTSL